MAMQMIGCGGSHASVLLAFLDLPNSSFSGKMFIAMETAVGGISSHTVHNGTMCVGAEVEKKLHLKMRNMCSTRFDTISKSSNCIW